MRIHPRTMPVQAANGEFCVSWARLDAKHYEDSYRIWNIVDRFWIEASQEEWSLEKACEEWTKKDLEPAVKKLGNDLVRVVREYELTYAEIYSVMLNARTLTVKYHIRSERHPDDLDAPGDLA